MTDKLPVPEIQLTPSDKGTVFMSKMNALAEAMRSTITAYNSQIDAAETVDQFLQPMLSTIGFVDAQRNKIEQLPADALAASALAAQGSNQPIAGVPAAALVQRVATAEQRIDDLPAQVDAAGTAAALLTTHNHTANAHPELSAAINVAVAQAEAAAEAAADAVQYKYFWRDDAERDAQSGMQEGEIGYMRSNEHIYKYDDSAWLDLGPSPSAKKADKSAVEPGINAALGLASVYQSNIDSDDYEYVWTCPHPTDRRKKLVVGGIKRDGTWQLSELLISLLRASNVSADVADVLSASISDLVASRATVADLTVTNKIAGQLTSRPVVSVHDYEYVVYDRNNKIAGGVKGDGTLHYAAIDADYFCGINGRVLRNSVTVNPYFAGDIAIIANYGQSLAQGPIGSISNDQQYDTIAYPAQSANPVAWSPATAATASLGGNREIPAFGACDTIKRLISIDNGIEYTDQQYQLLICNAAYAGFSIVQLSKGSDPYARLINQISTAKLHADASDMLLSAGAMLYAQGEADYLASRDTNARLLLRLATDYKNDVANITGSEPIFIVSQTTSQISNYKCSVQLAVIDVYNAGSIVISAPQYMYDYLDDGHYAHVTAAHTYIIGAYAAFAYKRTLIDQKIFEPLLISSVRISGNIAYVRFNKTGLVIDVDTVPEQPHYGFSVTRNSISSDELQIESVSVVQPDTIKLICTSAIPPAAVIWLGAKQVSNKQFYRGGATNIRDSAGDNFSINDWPMHNWALVQQFATGDK